MLLAAAAGLRRAGLALELVTPCGPRAAAEKPLLHTLDWRPLLRAGGAMSPLPLLESRPVLADAEGRLEGQSLLAGRLPLPGLCALHDPELLLASLLFLTDGLFACCQRQPPRQALELPQPLLQSFSLSLLYLLQQILSSTSGTGPSALARPHGYLRTSSTASCIV